jgi:hypothetical protein
MGTDRLLRRMRNGVPLRRLVSLAIVIASVPPATPPAKPPEGSGAGKKRGQTLCPWHGCRGTARQRRISGTWKCQYNHVSVLGADGILRPK